MKSGNPAWSAIPAALRVLTWRSGGHDRHVAFGANDGPPSARVAQPAFVPQNFGVNLLFEGTARYVDADNIEHALAPGAFYTRRPGRPSTLALTSAPSWREWFFTIDPATFADLEACGLLRPRSLVSTNLPPTLLHAWRDLRRSLDHRAPPAATEILHALVGLLQQAASSSPPAPAPSLDTRLAQAARLLESDLAAPLDLAAVADTVGLGHETLRKTFRARYSISPGRYRIRKRIELAKALLAQDSLPIKEIASLLGYSDPFAFSAQFRAHVGHSPRAHRTR